MIPRGAYNVTERPFVRLQNALTTVLLCWTAVSANQLMASRFALMIVESTRTDIPKDIAFASPHQSVMRAGSKIMTKLMAMPMQAARTRSSPDGLTGCRMFIIRVVLLYVRCWESNHRENQPAKSTAQIPSEMLYNTKPGMADRMLSLAITNELTRGRYSVRRLLESRPMDRFTSSAPKMVIKPRASILKGVHLRSSLWPQVKGFSRYPYYDTTESLVFEVKPGRAWRRELKIYDGDPRGESRRDCTPKPQSRIARELAYFLSAGSCGALPFFYFFEVLPRY